ncbi:hypothetical protein H6F43_18115 [Leptolyngbya sp. FACHB-36]|uniref:hypothetical protein n=1 Tax=Leptolyngbya sp. FACHB-36 TaxID=2692808 RepID=UPI0016819E5A|nr:hypothetical protein [Leptolyngbya sp. FACHB-36]MBD2022097.1 hypothetical protein [Leptolyngbya sp. FACHB-36]
MTSHFITLSVDLRTSPVELNRAVEAELQKHGEPLRWAIVAVDSERQTVIVEAIVTQ